jgi:membrane protease YdiL (CAAX protease family)
LENKPFSTNRSGAFYNTWGLAFVLIFLFLFQLIFYFVAVYSAGLIFGLSFHQVLNILTEPDGTSQAINIARYTNVVAFTGSMFLPVLLFSIINRTSLKIEGGFQVPIKKQLLFLALLILALAIPLVDYVTAAFQTIPLPQSLKYWANHFEHTREEQFNTLLDMHRPVELIFCLFTVGLLPALFEELMFRGVLLRIFSNILRKKWTPIILQAVVFSVLHFSFFQLPGILFMGILFGYISMRTGTVIYGVIMHFLFNATSIVLYYFNYLEFDKTGVFGKYKSIPLSPLLAIAALAGIVILVRLFNKVATANELEVHE